MKSFLKYYFKGYYFITLIILLFGVVWLIAHPGMLTVASGIVGFGLLGIAIAANINIAYTKWNKYVREK